MERLGPYQDLREVARGGMGVVYRARDGRTGQEVALKLLLPGRSASPAQRQRFEREARALAALRHPGIVRVLDLGEERGAPFLALEWVEGESLQTRLDREGPLPLPEAIALTAALADAVGHAHAQGVLHRDLKPDNVLLRRDGRPVLTDFGLARLLLDNGPEGPLTRTGQLLGTPGYWAPELALGQRERVGAWSDVYGLGALCYAALTGRPPQGEAGSLIEALARAEAEVAPPSTLRREVDRALDALLLRCLARDPGQRPPGAAALAVELRAWGAPRAARRRGGAGLAVAILLGGVAASGLLVRRGASTSPSPAPAREPEGVPSPAPASTPAAPASPVAPSDAGREDERAGWQLLGAGDMAGALAAFERALALEPDRPESLQGRAFVRAVSGDTAGALADLDRALELAPEYYRALLLRGQVLTRLLRLDEALRDLDLAARLDPSSTSVLLARASARDQSHDPRGALADLDRALELGTDSPVLRCNRGAALIKLGRYQDGLEDYRRAEQLDPSLPNAIAGQGIALRYLGQLVEASQLLGRAAELMPDDPNTWLHLGQALTDLEQWERARAALERSRTLRPADPEVWRALAVLASRRAPEDTATPQALLDRALELDPDHLESLLNRSALALLRDDVTAALADAERAVALGPDTPGALAARGAARGQGGDLEGGLVDLERAVALGDVSAPTHYARGCLRHARGDLAGAVADYRQALSHETWRGPARSEAQALLARAEQGLPWPE